MNSVLEASIAVKDSKSFKELLKVNVLYVDRYKNKTTHDVYLFKAYTGYG